MSRTHLGRAWRRVFLWTAISITAALGLNPMADAAGSGTITGTVKLNGGSAHLEDVIVSVEGLRYPATNGKVPAPAELILDQKDLTFVPHVLPVPVGVPVTFRNNDAVLHNVHSTSTLNTAFNYAMMKGKTKKTSFEHPEVIPIQCNVHSEMSAFILVKDNPFYARPSKDGRFTITGVPPGSYTIRAWHEKAGTVDQQATVTDGGTATVDFTLGK